MSKEKLIDYKEYARQMRENCARDYNGTEPIVICSSELWEKIATIIEGFDKQSEGEWISVKDKLPTPFVSVLVYMPDETPHPTVREGFINKRGEWYAGGFDRLPDEVVSWMKMPEAPKMKGGAEE